MQIKKGDSVKVIVGKDNGKTGKVLRAFPKLNQIIVDGVNMKKRHQRARKQGAKGQIVEMSALIHASNVIKNK